MVAPLQIATVASALSILVLVGLTAVWVRNYREFGTPLVLALIVFGVVLLLENAVALYFLVFSMDMLYATDDPTVRLWVATLRSLQLLALLALGWATAQ